MAAVTACGTGHPAGRATLTGERGSVSAVPGHPARGRLSRQPHTPQAGCQGGAAPPGLVCLRGRLAAAGGDSGPPQRAGAGCAFRVAAPAPRRTGPEAEVAGRGRAEGLSEGGRVEAVSASRPLVGHRPPTHPCENSGSWSPAGPPSPWLVSPGSGSFIQGAAAETAPRFGGVSATWAPTGTAEGAVTSNPELPLVWDVSRRSGRGLNQPQGTGGCPGGSGARRG